MSHGARNLPRARRQARAGARAVDHRGNDVSRHGYAVSGGDSGTADQGARLIEQPVFIVGAGPTGLVLALWLTRLGVKVRIIDKTAEPGTTSRALAVQTRTLEFYRQIDLAATVAERGLRLVVANFWVRATRVARARFGDGGVGLSPFPYALIFPQDEHERVLIERLRERGVTVERRVELVGFEDAGDRVRARLRRADGTEEACQAAYIAGCDGAHSTVRDRLAIGFPGGTYAQLFYVAGVAARGPAMGAPLHAALGEAEFLLVFPLKGDRRARLIGVVRDDAETRHDALTWNDVSKDVIDRMSITVERVNWFSTYQPKHSHRGHPVPGPSKRRSQAVRERKTSVLRACRVPNPSNRLNVVQRPKPLFEPQRSMTARS